jgi:hypothetical protein
MIAHYIEHLNKYKNFYYFGIYNASNEQREVYGTVLATDEIRYDIFGVKQ